MFLKCENERKGLDRILNLGLRFHIPAQTGY